MLRRTLRRQSSVVLFVVCYCCLGLINTVNLF
jgi:hypothetical protein